MLEILKAVIYGIVEGITEWLPVSSTGHMILLEKIMPLEVTAEFWNMFLVVIQLGAILAVVLIFWNKIFPFHFKEKQIVDWKIMNLWVKILIACIPAGIVGVLFDDWLDEHLYNFWVVSVMLILVGIVFIIVENWNQKRKRRPVMRKTQDITYQAALLIGIFQLIAAVFPGTSRSGATIIGALLIGVSRTAAAEFTFYLSIPVMFGASLLKLLKFGFSFTAMEIGILLSGMIVSFVVSVVVIRFLMGYIKKHDFKVFGWYRIVLGAVVLLYFGVLQ